MPEGIVDLAVALAPELIGELMTHLSAGCNRSRPESVGVVRLDLQDRGGTADRRRRDDAGVWELGCEMEARLADGELDAHDAAAWKGHTTALLGSERLDVPR